MRPKFRILALAALCLLALTALAGRPGQSWPVGLAPQGMEPLGGPQPPVFFRDFVNPEVEGGICHVSSLASLGDGRLAAVWYSGSREGAGDVSIFISRYTPSGEPGHGVWSEPEVLLDRKAASRQLDRYLKKLGNPVIFSASGRLWLFYATVSAGGWSGATLNYTVSDDGGLTWSRSRKLILSPFFNLTNNVKNSALRYSDGSFLLPIYHEFARKYSLALYFRPTASGLRYEVRKMTSTGRAIQPALVPTGGTEVTALFRNITNSRPRFALASRSSDLGRTWGPLVLTGLPNPNSGFDALPLAGGGILAAANNSHENRETLSLMLSRDGGLSWRQLMLLESLGGAEYSYPSFARGGDGLLHLSYTYERRRIRHLAFTVQGAAAAGDSADSAAGGGI